MNMNEHKKGFKAKAYPKKSSVTVAPSKPRNPVAKNASAAIGGGASGAHKDKKKAAKQGDVKHKKSVAAMAEGVAYDNRLDQLLNTEFEATGVNEMRNQRDAYQRDYDSSISGFSRPNDHRGLGQELAHERNNLAVSINGKLWKVFPGQGTADSQEEYKFLSKMKDWAEKKSFSTGKKWTVSLTGANPTEGVAEDSDESDNFTPADLKSLERIRDLPTLKARAKELIKGKPVKRMKPEKIAFFYDRVDQLNSPLAIIKMMYDMLLAGEGHKVIGSKSSMDPNSYRARFGENAEYDDEAGMADNNLETLKRAVDGLDNVISAGDNLPEWCQEKIAVAKNMLVTVWDYMQSEKEQGVAEGADPFRSLIMALRQDAGRYLDTKGQAGGRNFLSDINQRLAQLQQTGNPRAKIIADTVTAMSGDAQRAAVSTKGVSFGTLANTLMQLTQQELQKISQQGVAEGSLNEFAPDGLMSTIDSKDNLPE
jgi:hypothetical protein